MLFSGFRIRSAKRDRETDRTRFDRLSHAISKLRDDIEKERDGLERRYSETRTSAAFAQASFENEGDPKLSSKVDDLTASMLHYSARIDSLQKQIEFVGSLKNSVADFSEGIVKPGADEI